MEMQQELFSLAWMVVDLVALLANNVKTDLISLKYALHLPSGV